MSQQKPFIEFCEYLLERQQSISFSKDSEDFDLKPRYLTVEKQIKEETLTPKFFQNINFTDTIQNNYQDTKAENTGRTSVIKSKTNCLADYPEIQEFFSLNDEKINSASCYCLIF